MKKFLIVALVLLALPSISYAQAEERIPIGTMPTVAWNHDGLNVTHFRIYQAPATAPTSRVKIGNDIPVALITGGQQMTFPIKLSTIGKYVLYVAAVNLGVAGVTANSNEIFSAPLPIEVYVPVMPNPSQPMQFRIVGTVASNGSLNFVLEASTVTPAGQVVWTPYTK